MGLVDGGGVGAGIVTAVGAIVETHWSQVVHIAQLHFWFHEAPVAAEHWSEQPVGAGEGDGMGSRVRLGESVGKYEGVFVTEVAVEFMQTSAESPAPPVASTPSVSSLVILQPTSLGYWPSLST